MICIFPRSQLFWTRQQYGLVTQCISIFEIRLIISYAQLYWMSLLNLIIDGWLPILHKILFWNILFIDVSTQVTKVFTQKIIDNKMHATHPLISTADCCGCRFPIGEIDSAKQDGWNWGAPETKGCEHVFLSLKRLIPVLYFWKINYRMLSAIFTL